MMELASTPLIEDNLDYWRRRLKQAQTDVSTAERQIAAWTRELERRRSDKLDRADDGE